jgi:catechol 2,3-dioxygenase-like lactoylglutathione lyase family enzyme
MSPTTSSTAIARLGRVMVPVSDQDAAIAFYTEKLGFEVRADVAYETPEGPDRWIELGPAGGEANIALVPPRGEYQTGRNVGIAFDSDDVEADHATLRERGVDVDDEVLEMPGVPPMFWLRDQDENILLIVQAPER